jgi:hypothetical protein
MGKTLLMFTIPGEGNAIIARNLSRESTDQPLQQVNRVFGHYGVTTTPSVVEDWLFPSENPAKPLSKDNVLYRYMRLNPAGHARRRFQTKDEPHRHTQEGNVAFTFAPARIAARVGC